MKFKLTITKDVIDRSIFCGIDRNLLIIESCALSIAYRDLIPDTVVGPTHVLFYTGNRKKYPIDLTGDQKLFVYDFDREANNSQRRYALVGQEFDIEIPDEVILYYYQDYAKAAEKIANSNILKLVDI